MYNNIPFALLLEMLIVFVVLYGLFFFVSRLLVTSEEPNEKRAGTKVMIFKIKIILWSVFTLFYLYRFFQHHIIFTSLFILLVLLLFWNQWRDLIAGLFLKLNPDLHPGDKIRIGDKQGILERISWLKTILRLSDGASEHIPNRISYQEGFALLKNTGTESIIHITVDRSALDALGGKEAAQRKLMASPWADPGYSIEFETLDQNEVLIKARAKTPENKADYQAFLRDKFSKL